MIAHIPITLPEVTAAAILHDIGKMIQRTRNPAYRDPDKENLCPFNTKKNYHTHLHVLYTSGFLKAKQHTFPDEMNPERVATLAAKHHQPDTPYQWIIAEADRLSSGCDRSEKEISETDNRYFEQPLRCIFDKISFGENQKKSKEHFYPLLPLEPDNVLHTGAPKVSPAEYASLLSGFEKDFEKLSGLKTDMFFDALDTMLEHYLWSIPSSTIDEPDISLYDHSRTTAALAAVLYQFHQQQGNIEETNAIRNRSVKKYLLVSGDLSGIQNYIFDIRKSKFAAKILRAKSFELQAMMASVSRYILEKLNLPGFCQIMNAGGRFILLLPNTEDALNKLNKIRTQTENYCLHRFMGELSLNISQGVEASGEMLMQKNSENLFRLLSKDVQHAKLHRFQGILNQPEDFILDANYDAFTGSQDECPLCEKRPRGDHDLCPVCRNLQKVGTILPKSKLAGWLPKDSGPIDSLSYPWKASFRFAPELSSVPDNCFPAYINTYSPGFPLLKTPYHVPVSPSGDILTFEELGNEAKGASHIAMFKADVDNLGGIFTIGMKDRISLSRFATLSRMMDYFFTTLLNEFVAEEFPNIYIVFSGGDDLCLIGPWSELVHFAEKLQQKFEDFTGNNPNVTISAGISLAHSGTPILSIAREAEKELEKSKSGDKNQCTLFGVTTDWAHYRELLSLTGKWSDWVDKKKLNLAIVYRLLGYTRAKREAEKGEIKGNNMLWKSHLHYDVSRNIEAADIRESFLQDVATQIDFLPIPASTILYQNRQGGNNEH